MPRGQKSCPVCNVTTGPRTQICPNCNHDYQVGVKKIAAASNPVASSAPATGNMAELVFQPVGPCPEPYRGNLVEWVKAMRGHRPYANEALKKYLREQVNDDEWKSLSVLMPDHTYVLVMGKT